MNYHIATTHISGFRFVFSSPNLLSPIILLQFLSLSPLQLFLSIYFSLSPIIISSSNCSSPFKFSLFPVVFSFPPQTVSPTVFFTYLSRLFVTSSFSESSLQLSFSFNCSPPPLISFSKPSLSPLSLFNYLSLLPVKTSFYKPSLPFFFFSNRFPLFPSPTSLPPTLSLRHLSLCPYLSIFLPLSTYTTDLFT